MSLILDALKKAERQHRLGEVPGLGTSHQDDGHVRSRLFGILLVGIVAIGMLTLGIYLGEEEPVQREDKIETPGIMLPSPQSTRPLMQLDPPEKAENDLQADGKMVRIQIERENLAKSEPDKKPSSSSIPKVEKNATEKAAKTMADSRARPPIEKPLSQLPPGFVDQLPTLNIDIHSYDEQQGRSYVLINMEKYREGDYLAEGPLLYEILKDGVVLEHMGERFILPIGNH